MLVLQRRVVILNSHKMRISFAIGLKIVIHMRMSIALDFFIEFKIEGEIFI